MVDVADLCVQYIGELHQTLDGILPKTVKDAFFTLQMAQLGRHTVFILGNGGSATTASHFAEGLSRCGHRVKAISLADSLSSLTAYANDEGYENVFLFSLVNWLGQGDVVIAISASGNSPNVLRAVEYAKNVGVMTIGMTGFDGGKLGKLVDIHMNVPCQVVEQVEDVHLVLTHILSKAMREQ